MQNFLYESEFDLHEINEYPGDTFFHMNGSHDESFSAPAILNSQISHC